ncbi:MAG: hypothetical protein WC234_05775 [Endomicrobiaceae bacterium]
MIKNIITPFNKNRYAECLLKILCLAVIVFICFNSIFSSFMLNYNRDDLTEISLIQKDVFSAVFFISGTIEKINDSLSDRLGLKTDSAANEKKRESQPVSTSSKDIILIENNQNQNIKILKFLSVYSEKIAAYCNFYIPLVSYCENNFLYSKNSFYFIVMMLFFASSKKIYVYLNKINCIYINPLAV